MSTTDDGDAEVLVLSCVGGGVPERLARSITEAGIGARLVTGNREAWWRRRASRGAASRRATRLRAFIWYPLLALFAVARSKARALIATTNPFHLPFLLVAARPLHRRPVIVLVYDLYPDVLEAAGGRARRVGSLLAAGNRFVFRRADHVVFIGDRFGAHARARYGTPRRWSTIPTGGDAGEFAVAAVTPLSEELERWRGDRLLVTYVGHLGAMHDWATLHGLAQAVDARDGVAIAFFASGRDAERLRAACRGLSEDVIRFESPLELVDWRAVMTISDVALVTLRPESIMTSVPSKAYSALAAGAALLAVVPDGSDIADLIEAHGCGRRIDPGDERAARDTLRSWASDRARLTEVRRQARLTASSTDLSALAVDWIDVIQQASGEEAPLC